MRPRLTNWPYGLADVEMVELELSKKVVLWAEVHHTASALAFSDAHC